MVCVNGRNPPTVPWKGRLSKSPLSTPPIALDGARLTCRQRHYLRGRDWHVHIVAVGVAAHGGRGLQAEGLQELPVKLLLSLDLAQALHPPQLVWRRHVLGLQV